MSELDDLQAFNVAVMATNMFPASPVIPHTRGLRTILSSQVSTFGAIDPHRNSKAMRSESSTIKVHEQIGNPWSALFLLTCRIYFSMFGENEKL